MQNPELNFTSPVRDMQLCSDVRISKPVKNNGKMFIKSIKTQALWDTGAVTSGISGRLADKLGLEVRERALLSTAAGCVPAFKDIVLLDLLLDDTVIPVKAVVVDDIPGDGNNFLIGMDVIQCGSLSIDTAHLEGNFHVCFKPYPGLFKSLKEMLGK